MTSAGDDVEVTIALEYADAVALSRGELSPAEALAGGRVRVRGRPLGAGGRPGAAGGRPRAHPAPSTPTTTY